MNIYDKESFNIESIDENSDGLHLAKLVIISRLIIALYGIAFDFVILFYLYARNREWFDGTFPVFLIVGTLYFCLSLVLSSNVLFANKAKKLPLQERHDFNLYLYHKLYYRRKGYRNQALLALAKNDAMAGNREQCKQAIDLISDKFDHPDLKVLNEWINSDREPLSLEDFQVQKRVNPLVLIITGLIILYGASYVGLNSDMFYFSALPGYFILLSGAIASLSAAFIYTLAICLITIKFGHKKINKILIAILLIFFFIFSFITVGKDSYYYFRYRHTGLYYGESYDDSEDSEDDLYDNYSYDYSEDYEDDYNIDNSSEPIDDVDIMNMMIILSGYLKEHGMIEDYYTNLLISYSAKGNVRGTVYRDEEYEYNLYDNGSKLDEDGNECLELVLEAEPLGEDGFSKGQSEAILKGFYLMNIETNEIIDEHKTHW